MPFTPFSGPAGDVGQLNAAIMQLFQLYDSWASGRVNLVTGDDDLYSDLRLGRAGPELHLGVAAEENSFSWSTAPGDVVLLTAGGVLWLGNSSFACQVDGSGNFKPASDNVQTAGAPAQRWSVVYAATGAINTSDSREKTAVAQLSAAEMDAARLLAAEVGTFKYLAAIDEKGSAARLHVGMTVQRAIEIMAAQGLDATRYGFICHDSWPAEGATSAGDRYGFRTDELLLFIARGQEARLAALEAALA